MLLIVKVISELFTINLLNSLIECLQSGLAIVLSNFGIPSRYHDYSLVFRFANVMATRLIWNCDFLSRNSLLLFSNGTGLKPVNSELVVNGLSVCEMPIERIWYADEIEFVWSYQFRCLRNDFLEFWSFNQPNHLVRPRSKVAEKQF